MNTQEFEDGVLVYSRTYDLAAGTVTVFEDGVTTTVTADPDDIAAIRQAEQDAARRLRLAQAVSTLRAWAADARGVDVAPMTATQHKQVTQTLVNRLGVFFDRFADLLEDR